MNHHHQPHRKQRTRPDFGFRLSAQIRRLIMVRLCVVCVFFFTGTHAKGFRVSSPHHHHQHYTHSTHTTTSHANSVWHMCIAGGHAVRTACVFGGNRRAERSVSFFFCVVNRIDDYCAGCSAPDWGVRIVVSSA